MVLDATIQQRKLSFTQCPDRLGKFLLTPLLFCLFLTVAFVAVSSSDSTDLQKMKFWVELDQFGSGNRIGLSRAWFIIPLYELGLSFYLAVATLLAAVFTIVSVSQGRTAAHVAIGALLLLTNLYVLQLSSHLTRQSLALLLFFLAAQREGKTYIFYMVTAILLHEVVLALAFFLLFFFEIRLYKSQFINRDYRLKCFLRSPSCARGNIAWF